MQSEVKDVKSNWRGIAAVCGAFTLNVLAGNFNNWGALSPYITSYLHSYDSSVTNSAVYLASPCGLIGDLIGVFCAPYLKRAIGVKLTLLLGVCLLAGGLFICSVATNLWVLVLGYGLTFGFGTGTVTLCGIWPCWTYYQASKGKVTGIICAGISLGTTAYNLLFTYLLNPTNSPAYTDPVSNDCLFPEEVYSKVPSSFRLVALYVLLIGCIAICMLSEKAAMPCMMRQPTFIIKDRARKSVVTYRFWMLFFITYGMFIFSGYTNNTIKIIGLKYIHDDHMLSYIGCFANLIAILGRLALPGLLDLYSFKKVVGSILALHLVLCSTMPLVYSNATLFTTYICCIFLSSAGLYPAQMVQASRMFGPRVSCLIWPFFEMAIVLAGFSAVGCLWLGTNYAGYELMNYVISGCIGMAMILIFCLPKKNVIKDEETDAELSESFVINKEDS